MDIHVMNITDKRVRAIIAYNELFTDIVVNPLESFIVWGKKTPNPAIIKANQDGSHRKVLVDSNIKYPNSIVIEFETKKIYFMEHSSNEITSIDFYGNNRRLIYKLEINVQLAEKVLDIYDKNLFIYNYQTEDIVIISTDGISKDKIVINKMKLFRAMKIIHSSRQPNGENKCIDSNCTHLCLPNENDFKCVCPSDQYLLSGEKCQTVSYILYKNK
jgi:hypothetical protein